MAHHDSGHTRIHLTLIAGSHGLKRTPIEIDLTSIIRLAKLARGHSSDKTHYRQTSTKSFSIGRHSQSGE